MLIYNCSFYSCRKFTCLFYLFSLLFGNLLLFTQDSRHFMISLCTILLLIRFVNLEWSQSFYSYLGAVLHKASGSHYIWAAKRSLFAE